MNRISDQDLRVDTRRPAEPRRSFSATVRDTTDAPLLRTPLSVLQVNLGRLCNQACEHCHVDAGPKRREIMSREVQREIVSWCAANRMPEVDITGGAPEMNPGFREFVDALLGLGVRVGVRCNLTILLEEGFEDLVDWYAERRIALVCSLPCYTAGNVDGQRGKGVFDKSIEVLKRLNAAGYAIDDDRTLDLVYNPGGAFLPPPQDKLEDDYRRELGERFGIRFTRLLALANLPINRFARFLENNGQLDAYRDLLRSNFNADTVAGLMCRHLVSVDWRGYVYDCDFNQMLDLPLPDDVHHRPRLTDITPDDINGRTIATAGHCFGCTAGAGSSCGGSLS